MSAIYEQLATIVLSGNEAETPVLVEKALASGEMAKDILDNGLIMGMNEVSDRFKRGAMFVPEVLMSAKAMHAGLDVLRPQLAATGSGLIGKIILGTVKGDLHAAEVDIDSAHASSLSKVSPWRPNCSEPAARLAFSSSRFTAISTSGISTRRRCAPWRAAAWRHALKVTERMWPPEN